MVVLGKTPERARGCSNMLNFAEAELGPEHRTPPRAPPKGALRAPPEAPPGAPRGNPLGVR
eukprot:10394845-Alexandrium_andersonii.AAC.1